MIRSSSIIILVAWAVNATLASASPQVATAAQKEALRSHCAKDFLAHCSGVPRGGVPAFKCLEQNLDSLSSVCRTAVDSVHPEGKSSAPSTGN
jgi:hypothetical protein